jgi:hypothetical protein
MLDHDNPIGNPDRVIGLFTAVQVMPSNGPTEWQEEYEELTRQSRRVARTLVAAE